MPSTSSVRLASPSGWGLHEGKGSLPSSRGSLRSSPAMAPSSSDRSLRPEAADSLRATALELLAASTSSSRSWEPEGSKRAGHPLGLQRRQTRGRGYHEATLPSPKASFIGSVSPLPQPPLSFPCFSQNPSQRTQSRPHITQQRGQAGPAWQVQILGPPLTETLDESLHL